MSEQTTDERVPRNVDSWAKPVDSMTVGEMPSDAINLNVAGRRPTSPMQGFGQLWQKTYTLRITDRQIPPQEIISEWKAHFPDFWPPGNNFYGPMTGVAPGEVAVLNIAGPGGMTLSTGIRVIYADEESFSFMTPEGHMFAGMITFNSELDGDQTVVNIQALLRANDPVYEMSFRMGIGHKAEDKFWHQTLMNLAAHFNATGVVTQRNVLVDKKVQWSKAGNVWQNAAIRTGIYMPVHFAKKLIRR